MNLSEFKAWFEGFTENLDGKPTDKQWKRITAKIAEIVDAPPVSYPVYVDRYWRYSDPWYRYHAGYASGTAGAQGLSAVGQNSGEMQKLADLKAQYASFNSADGFRALGRADAENLN